MKLSFHTVADLLKVRRFVMPVVKKNKERASVVTGVGIGSDLDDYGSGNSWERSDKPKTVADQLENMVDIR